MSNLDNIKHNLHDLLIEKGGNVNPWDLNDIFAKAKEIGLDEKQVHKLLVEADQAINWEAIRIQKEESIKKVEELKRVALEQSEKEQNAGETLDFMIKQCAADKVINASEIAVFFEVSDSLKQNEKKSAQLFKTYIEDNNYIPLVTPNGTTIRQILLSTDWYKDKLPPPPPPPPPPPAPFPWKLFIVASVLILAISGGFFYNFWLKDYLKDKKAKRYYSYVNIMMRSSQMSGVEYNVVQKLPYGTELLVYDDNPYSGEWVSAKANEQKGYVGSQYILSKRDFYELNGIFADIDSRDAVETAKCRMALLKYFQDTISRNIMGKIDPAIQLEIYGKQKNREIWQIFTRPKDIKPNAVAFARITDPNSKFTDFGCLIKNISTGKRKFLLFAFSETGVPRLAYEADAPDSGYIKSMSKSYNNTPIVRYSN